MNLFHAQITLLNAASEVVGFAGNWLLQSTLLITVGLAVGWLARRRGSAVQSAVYRTTLAGVLVCPLATWLLALSGASGWSLAMPAAWTYELAAERLPAGTDPLIGWSTLQHPRLTGDEPLAAGSGEPVFHAEPDPDVGWAAPTNRTSNQPGGGRSLRDETTAGHDMAAAPAREDAGSARIQVHFFGVAAVCIAALWLSASGMLLLRFASACRRLAGIRRGAVPADSAVVQTCHEVASKLEIPAPEVLRSPFLPSPCLTGLRRPAVLLPEADLSLPLTDVLIHELAHLSRRDCHWNLLRGLATAVFFYQPLLWKLSRRLEATAEEVCDDYVVQFVGKREKYAHRLVDVAELAVAPLTGVGVGIVSLRSLLARRVERILDTSRSLSTRVGSLVLLVVLLGGTVGTAIVGLVGVGPNSSLAEAQPSDDALRPRADNRPADVSTKPATAMPDDKNEYVLEYAGTVVDPDGEPVEGAEIFFAYWVSDAPPDDHPKALATTDARGRFRFTARKSDFDDGAEGIWDHAALVATADGYGFAHDLSAIFETTGRVRESLTPERLEQLQLALGLIIHESPQQIQERLQNSDRVLRLVADNSPLAGKVVTSDGLPVENARIRVDHVWWSDDESLDAWEEAVEEEKADFYVLRRHTPRSISGAHLASILPEVTTNARGEFTLRGIGRERVAQLLITGPSIEGAQVKARTRTGDKVEVPIQWEYRDFPGAPPQIYYGAKFTHVAGQSRPVIGRVTDADTGEPIPGVTIRGTSQNARDMRFIRAVTEAAGRYRLEGLAIGRAERVVVLPPDDSAYLPAGDSFTVEMENTEFSRDFRLNRGVWLQGRAVDDRSGEPVRGRVEYFVPLDNPHLKSYEGFGRLPPNANDRWTDDEGRFRLPVLPGRGIITFMASNHQAYRRGFGVETIDVPTETSGSTGIMYRTAPYRLISSNAHVLRQIEPGPDSPPVEIELKLTAGGDVAGRVVDPEGNPISGALVSGRTDPDSWSPIRDDTFTIQGYYADRPRDLYFFHPESGLGAYYHLEGPPPEEVIVELKPTGGVRGRLVNDAGLPLPGYLLRGEGVPKYKYGDADLRLETDDEGRFLVRGLLPGRKYTLTADPNAWFRGGVVAKGLTVEAGELRDLGDVQLVDEAEAPDDEKTDAAQPAAAPTEVSKRADNESSK